MAEKKTTLRPTATRDVYEDVKGGSEPLFVRSVEHGEVQFGHQSGYGYLPESRVVIDGVLASSEPESKGGA